MSLKELIENRNENFDEVIRFFENEILPKVQLKINTGRFHRMSSKLNTELLPTNQRNLTDARTRIGTLLEYQFAYELNNLLKDEYNLEEYDVGFVLANQYPDLVIRNEFHEVVLRIEMKSIQGISEEKSANFDALIRNIEEKSDILCIILWEWNSVIEKEATIEYPEISKIYFFNAYEIAKIRDYSWLKNTKGQTGNKIVDVSGVYVHVEEDVFKKEEGNLGKLLRIGIDDENNIEGVKYEKFKNEVQLFGIQQIVKSCLNLIIEEDKIVEFDSREYDKKEVQLIYQAFKNDTSLLILAGNRRSPSKILEKTKIFLEEIQSDFTYTTILNEKFDWILYESSLTENIKVDEGKKPQTLYKKLEEIFNEEESPH